MRLFFILVFILPLSCSENPEHERPEPVFVRNEAEAAEWSKRENKPALVMYTMLRYVADYDNLFENINTNPAADDIREHFVFCLINTTDTTIFPDTAIATTYGQAAASFMKTRYQTNASPLYVIIDSKNRLLATPTAKCSQALFQHFLETGMRNFETH
jgi:hypothetical protein